ncbi:hypothetical protein ANCDUO_15483, partial [Ancylostoma duodenale]
MDIDYLSSSEDEEGDSAANRPRRFKSRSLPFEVSSDSEFKKDFRFTKGVFYRICEMVADDMRHETSRGQALSVPQQVAMCLNLLGRNTKQRDSARMAGCDQGTVSRTLARFVNAMCARAGTVIFWPTDEERRRIRKKIFDSYHLPNIAGFIDGSHIRILGPRENESDYVNRKDYHSINVGAVCDDKLIFRWVSASFPGSAHDSRVFKESQLYEDLRSGSKKGCLVGDSAYAAESFLIKRCATIAPSVRPVLTSKEPLDVLKVSGKFSERSVGKFFRIDLVHLTENDGRFFSYDPDFATRIIICCFTLRNIAITAGETADFSDYEDSDDDDVEPPENALAGKALIRKIINDHF